MLKVTTVDGETFHVNLGRVAAVTEGNAPSRTILVFSFMDHGGDMLVIAAKPADVLAEMETPE